MTRRWFRRAVFVAIVAVALATAVAAARVPGTIAAARLHRERVRANEARAYAAAPVCDYRGQPSASCRRTQQYFVVRVYSGGIPTERRLVLGGDFLVFAANPCATTRCNPDLVEASPSALYSELRPGSAVTASVWQDHAIELRGKDGKVMQVYNRTASDGTDATGSVVLFGGIVAGLVVVATAMWRTRPRS
jgi:hypothetical protein